MSFHSQSPEHTHHLASLLAGCIDAKGLVIALCGDLGAGKTAFVKGLAAGLGVEPAVVSSPTYVLVHEYPSSEGRPSLAHVDFYRIESSAELEAVGFDDLLRPGLILAVEWADRFEEALPGDHLTLRLERSGQDAEGSLHRLLHVRANGPGASSVYTKWRNLAEEAGFADQNGPSPSGATAAP